MAQRAQTLLILAALILVVAAVFAFCLCTFKPSVSDAAAENNPDWTVRRRRSPGKRTARSSVK